LLSSSEDERRQSSFGYPILSIVLHVFVYALVRKLCE
jgi:hypothetical protein